MKADEFGDYLKYCGNQSNITRKIFIHGGGSAFFGGMSEACQHDPLGSLAIGLVPGFGVEIIQVLGGDEQIYPNALGDLFIWDLGGDVVGVLLSDLIFPSGNKKKGSK